MMIRRSSVMPCKMIARNEAMRERLLHVAFRSLVVICLSTGCSGCAGLGVYCHDRTNDALDAFTLSLGSGCGGKVRVGPLQIGLLQNKDVAGFRSGEFLSPHLAKYSHTRDVCTLVYPYSDHSEIIYGDECLDLSTRGKGFTANCALPFFSTVGQPPPSIQILWYYTQVEAVLGAGGTVRAGVNLGEIIDFVLGFVGVDIFADDETTLSALTDSTKGP